MILLLSEDLLDASKTIACARAVGLAILQFKTMEGLIQQLAQRTPACCIIDLQCPGLDLGVLMAAPVERKPRVIAYGSHVDGARLKAARDIGCDEVMPRSKYFEVMPSRIAEWAD